MEITGWVLGIVDGVFDGPRKKEYKTSNRLRRAALRILSRKCKKGTAVFWQRLEESQSLLDFKHLLSSAYYSPLLLFILLACYIWFLS